MRNVVFVLYLVASVLAVGCGPAAAPKRAGGATASFTGFYWAESADGNRFLRIGPPDDPIACSVTSTGTPTEVEGWFKCDHEGVSRGKYEIVVDMLKTTQSSKEGDVTYEAVRTESGLLVKSHSLINGHDASTPYTFISR